MLSSPIYIGKIIHKGVLNPGQHEAIVDMETWNRVAAQLKQNQVRRRNPHNLPSGRMLYGKLMSPDGQAFTPTHASKKGRRYLYYTLTKPISKTSTDEIRRLPAMEIEAKVIACVSCLLEDSLRLASHFKGFSPGAVVKYKAIAVEGKYKRDIQGRCVVERLLDADAKCW